VGDTTKFNMLLDLFVRKKQTLWAAVHYRSRILCAPFGAEQVLLIEGNP